MKVSMLLPVYNGGRYLAECLETVLSQDFADMEILIADNGSEDGSRKIIEQFAARDPRIRWWQNSRNLGMIGNHNVCLQEARGDYVKFVHADDKLLSPSAVSRLVAALDAHPGAVLAGARQHLTGTDAKPFVLSRSAGVFSGKSLIIAGLERNSNPVGPPIQTLFRRSAARRGFDDRFTGHLDTEMWFHLLEQGDFVFVPDILATWRVHERQQTSRNQASGKKDFEHLRLMEIYYAKPWLQEKATPRLLFAQIYYLRKHYGREADPLTSAMQLRLTRTGYAWQWLKHKITRPLQKLSRKFQ